MTDTPPKLLRLLGLLTLIGTGFPACADSVLPAGLTLNGFGTLGFARSTNSNAEFVRDLSQPAGVTDSYSARIDSLLGLQANYSINEQFEAAVQGISHYRYDASFSPELTRAYLKYSPTPNLSLRAGRIGTEFYLMADSRMVGYSVLTVRPPGDFFGMLPFNYIDGMDARVSLPLASGVLRGDIYSGLTTEKLPLQEKLWDLDGSRLSGASLEYQKGPWLARMSYARIDFETDLPIGALTDALRATHVASAIAAANSMGVANTRGTFRSLGAVYDDGTVQVQVAVARTERESVMFENDRSGYILAGYRLGQVTPFIGHSWVYSTPKSLDTGLPNANAKLIALNQLVATNVANSHSDQHTTTLGVRWDVMRNVDLKLQYDLQQGTPTSVFPVRKEQVPVWNGSTRVFSLAMDFIF